MRETFDKITTRIAFVARHLLLAVPGLLAGFYALREEPAVVAAINSMPKLKTAAHVVSAAIAVLVSVIPVGIWALTKHIKGTARIKELEKRPVAISIPQRRSTDQVGDLPLPQFVPVPVQVPGYVHDRIALSKGTISRGIDLLVEAASLLREGRDHVAVVGTALVDHPAVPTPIQSGDGPMCQPETEPPKAA